MKSCLEPDAQARNSLACASGSYRPPRVSAMKKKLAWVCLMVSPLVFGGAAFCLSNRDLITRANCDRIKPSMTVKEVEDILGKEPPCLISGGSFGGISLWRGARGTICVSYTGPFIWMDPQEDSCILVENAVFTPDSRTILDKIRNWFGL